MICFDNDGNFTKTWQNVLDMQQIDPRVKAIVQHLDFMLHDLHQHVVITSAHRGDKQTSPHFYFRAVDVRTLTWPTNLPQRIEAVINERYPYGDNEHQTAIYHDSGQGKHLHVQVSPPNC
jgi:hypothetical protein